MVWQRGSGGVVRESLGVSCDTSSTPTLPVIRVAPVCFGWDVRFTDYSIVVSSGGWRSGFRAFGRAKGLATVEESTLATMPSITMVGT
ncbi:hypothetical protein Hanom_Chr07g00584771 [Helianthus anomalus]